jgi:co-chaperonin GroES (HSP10)
MCPIQPLRDRVVIQPRVRKLSDIIFTINSEKMNEGTIVAIGPDVHEVRPGDFVKYGNGTYLDWPVQHFDGQDYQIIQEADIACVVEENHA